MASIRQLSTKLRSWVRAQPEFETSMKTAKLRFLVVGSFISVRIEDPSGQICYSDAHAVLIQAAHVLYDNQVLKSFRPPEHGYISGGIVGTWSLNN